MLPPLIIFRQSRGFSAMSRAPLTSAWFLPSSSSSSLVAFSDADWAGCPDTHRSTSCYSIFLGDNLVSWSAKKQPTFSRSNCESEYRALALTAAKVIWLTHLLYDLKVSLPRQPLLLCDNKSAIFLSSNPIAHKRAKHIDLDYHFLRKLVVAGKLRIQYVPSNLQVADIFTKSGPSNDLKAYQPQDGGGTRLFCLVDQGLYQGWS
ncbi:Copia protein [Morella rubra]|uniref:Copia protein n=1 Tax=Morella rubra TaxID=262757 RepID=A0A6A1WES9_9ROSI|nr:Copia protein [Morella rubra]